MSRDSVLVTADGAEQNLDTPGVVFVEVDEDTTAYDGGHIRGAVKLDWKTELQDPVRRDFVNKEQFEELLSRKGIGNDDTVVLYGGNNNWFAAYAYWYFRLYGHQDVKLLDGGRKRWELDSRELSTDELRELYGEAGLDDAKPTIAYCRIGERSSHTWFVLHELLGQQDVKNYDGSWTEYGSLVGVPIALGEEK